MLMKRGEKICLLVPELEGSTGGIQRYLNSFQDALEELLQDEVHIRLVVKNDTPSVLKKKRSSRVQIFCCGHRKGFLRNLLFCWHAFRRSQGAELLICGHVHFAALAKLIKTFTKSRLWVLTYGVESWSLRSRSKIAALLAADKILSISQFTADKIQEELPEKTSIEILPCAINEEDFPLGRKSPELLERYSLEHSTPVLLTVCRLEGQESFKPYDQVLEALPFLLETHTSLRYIIVGSGNDRRRLQELVRSRGLEQSVHLCGFLPHEQLVEHYQLADIFILPSKLEGFGIVYLEALACGTQVVGSAVDGSRDALLAGKLGTLVDPDNSSQIVQVVEELLEKADGEIEQKQRREKMLEHFSMKVFQEKLGKLLKEESKVKPLLRGN